jgi:hypothetical protein
MRMCSVRRIASVLRYTLKWSAGVEMYNARRLWAVATACLLLQGGCASITSGKEQAMTFDTEPGGADCALTQNNVDVSKFRTPSSFNVRRANTAMMLTCTKAGYHQARVLIANTISTGAWGNLVVGGIIGVMVDQSSGAAYRYYDPPKIALTPTSDPAPQTSVSVATGITVLPPGDLSTAAPVPVIAPAPVAATGSGQPASAMPTSSVGVADPAIPTTPTTMNGPPASSEPVSGQPMTGLSRYRL